MEKNDLKFYQQKYFPIASYTWISISEKNVLKKIPQFIFQVFNIYVISMWGFMHCKLQKHIHILIAFHSFQIGFTELRTKSDLWHDMVGTRQQH